MASALCTSNAPLPVAFPPPADWLLSVKSDTVREIDIVFRDDGA
jgi:hypothetical protein